MIVSHNRVTVNHYRAKKNLRARRAAKRRGADGVIRFGGGWSALLLRLLLILAMAGCTLLATASVHADVYDDRRTRAGVRVFRSLLSAEIGIENKAGEDGRLHLLIVGGEAAQVDELAALLAPSKAGKPATLRGLPLDVQRVEHIVEGEGEVPAGVFLAEAPDEEELEALIAWSIDHQVMLYSPFEGHVERGVMAGIAIEAKVRPYLNTRTIAEAGLELKPLFLKVSKVHP